MVVTPLRRLSPEVVRAGADAYRAAYDAAKSAGKTDAEADVAGQEAGQAARIAQIAKEKAG